MNGRRPAFLALLGASSLVEGCARLLGIDDYSAVPASAPAVPSASDAGSPFAPKPAYLRGEACERCMTTCKPQRDSCGASDVCAAWLEDRQTRPDPVSALERIVKPINGTPGGLSDAAWDADHGGTGEAATASSLLDSLAWCARTYCSEDCELGRDFSCFGTFEWPAPAAPAVDIRVRTVNGLPPRMRPVPGCAVRACTDPSCTSAWPAKQTDSEGFLDLVVPTVATRGFEGLLTFDCPALIPLADSGGGGDFIEEVAEVSLPWPSGLYRPLGILTTEQVAAIGKSVGIGVDPRMVLYFVVAHDCRGEPMTAVSLEVLIPDRAGSLRPCESCLPTSVPPLVGSTFSDLAYTAISGIIGPAPAGAALLVARDQETQRVVAAMPLAGHAGSLEHALLLPPSRRQVQALSVLR